MSKNKKEDKLDQLQGSTTVVGLDDFIQLLNSPKRLGLLRFYAGFMAGVGGVLGATAVIIVLGMMVKYLGGVPWIGDLIHQISSAAHAK